MMFDQIADITLSPLAMKPPSDILSRRDASPARMRAFRTALAEGKKEFFDDTYGEAQLNLMTLVTLPEYWRRGIGTKLAEWGVLKSREDNLTMTLFASPMGERLYKRMGFRQIGMATIRVDGEDVTIDIPAMVRDIAK